MQLRLNLKFIPSAKSPSFENEYLVAQSPTKNIYMMTLLRARAALKTPGKGFQDNQRMCGFISIPLLFPHERREDDKGNHTVH